MILIKITIIIAIIYGLLRWGLHVYITGLAPLDALRIKASKYTKNEKIFFSFVGLFNLLLIILVAASLISLVVKYI